MDSATATDVLAIQDLLGRYAVHLDRRDIDRFAEVFLPHSEMHVRGTVWQGRDDICAKGAASPLGIHIGAVPHISVDGDRATGLQNFVFINAADQSLVIGVYEDTYARVDGAWFIEVRRIVMVEPDAR